MLDVKIYAMSDKPIPLRKKDFPVFRNITTRWNDNDPYGHVNNIVYYAWFDSAINGYLIENGALDIQLGEIIGLVVRTSCDYFSPITFPEKITIGIRVKKIGNSSVHYELGVFREDEDSACAQGEFVHVYVDRQNNKPVSLPKPLLKILKAVS